MARIGWRTASWLIVEMNQRLKPLRISLVVFSATAVACVSSSAAHAARYRGFVDVLNGQPTREASQGAGWRTIFRERVPGRLRYTVCLVKAGRKLTPWRRSKTDPLVGVRGGRRGGEARRASRSGVHRVRGGRGGGRWRVGAQVGARNRRLRPCAGLLWVIGQGVSGVLAAGGRARSRSLRR